jgi:hypothetical protein
VIDTLVSRGYGTYIEIVEEFSPHEIERLYAAALAGMHRERVDQALATRVAHHADKKGWKSYTESIDKAVKQLLGKNPGGPNAKKSTAKDVSNFFSQLGSLPSKGSKFKDGEQVTGKSAIPVRRHAPRRRIDQ